MSWFLYGVVTEAHGLHLQSWQIEHRDTAAQIVHFHTEV